MSEGTFSHHTADCPLDSLILLSANQGRRLSRHSFVTFVESNAKALLTGSLSKMQTCKQVLRPAGGELSIGQLIVLLTEAAVSAALLPPFIRLHSTPQQYKVYIFCNLASPKSANFIYPALLRCSLLRSDFIQFPIP